MIVLITGGLGSGKTAILVRFGVKGFHLGRKIISNVKLFGVPFEDLDLVDIYLKEDDLNNMIILCDEFYTEMDSRVSMSKRNRLQSYLIAQTRKIDTDLYATSQFSDFVDLRLIRFVDIWVKMDNIWMINKRNNEIVKHPYNFEVTMYDYRQSEEPVIREFIFDGRPYFGYYDTRQRIKPPEDYINEPGDRS